MPFLYELTLAAGEPEYTVVQHLVPAGTLVGTGQAVAVLSDGKMEFHLQAPRQGPAGGVVCGGWIERCGCGAGGSHCV